MNQFLLKPYGVGRAVENKALNSNECEFTIIELFAFSEGEIKSDASDIKYSGPNVSGTIKESKVKFSKAIKAKWLSMDPNRKTAPDIRRGERAQVYRLGDTNTYYWKELGLDNDLRRLETVIYAFSNSSKNEANELAKDDFYFVEISTHAKLVTLKTSKSDGEPFSYLVQIDAKAGKFIIEDDIDNHIFIDSTERLIELENKDGTLVRLDKKKLTIHADDTIDITSKSVSISGSDSVSLRATKYSGSFSSYTMNSGSANMTTTLTVNGSVSTNGGLTNNGVNVGGSHTHFHGTPKTSTPS